MYAVTTEGLGRKFGDRWAVQDLDLQIEQGEVLGLLGPNGAGKTTTMRMLACLIAPSAGRASVWGFDVVRNPSEVRTRIGILTEAPGLYANRSALQNLELYAGLYGLKPPHARDQIERYLKLLGLWEQRFQPAGTLSKGMKQKLSMVRALLHEPPVLILDEPTSALDAEGAKLVRDFIASLKGEGRTILLCTHNMYEAQTLCDRVAIVKGTLLRTGTPRELQMLLYSRQVEVRVDPPPVPVAGTGPDYMQVAAEAATGLDGVGDVEIDGDRLLVSVTDADQVTPVLVDALVAAHVRILRVAEIEHTLENAYLDLITGKTVLAEQERPDFVEAIA
jgi:ABC-2 type transport system ATP-binding protein